MLISIVYGVISITWKFTLYRCHGESGIPELLYPHTKFPSECCTPVHDSLVDPVRGYNIRVVD